MKGDTICTNLITEFQTKVFATLFALEGAFVRVHRGDVSHQRDLGFVLLVAKGTRKVIGFHMRLDVIGQM